MLNLVIMNVFYLCMGKGGGGCNIIYYKNYVDMLYKCGEIMRILMLDGLDKMLLCVFEVEKLGRFVLFFNFKFL